jgi:hypothetical protein
MRHFRNFELEKSSVDAGYCSGHNAEDSSCIRSEVLFFR